MPLTRSSANAFGALTISLVILFHIFAIICIYQVVCLRARIQQRGFLQLVFFNGPWGTRIFLVVLAVCWSLSEIARLSFLKRLIFSLTWQRSLCKLYILFNLGFSEPSVFMTFIFLLRASLQKRDSGTLSRGWNKKTLGYIFIYCLPYFIMQLALAFAGPKLFRINKSGGRKDQYFTKANILIGDHCVCIYPLFSTILLGIFHAVLISYIVCIGMRVYLSVVNKQLLRRLYWLRLASLHWYTCQWQILWLWKEIWRGMVDLPFDGYYNDSASFVANQSYSRETRRSSDVSTKPGSISFRTMIKDDPPGSDGLDEISLSFPLHIGSPTDFSSTPAMPMLPLREIPRC